MTPRRQLLIALICCVAIAWLAGPVAHMLVILILLLFAPGYLFTRAFPDDDSSAQPHAAFILPAIWLGVSLSMVVLLYAWITAVGLAITPLVSGLLTAGCSLGVVYSIWVASDNQAESNRLSAHLPALALLLILALTVWLRFYQIRELALPAWVDSVHHALLIRVAAEQGQAPYSLQPYLPVDTLPYHWGYHAIIATAIQLSGFDLPQTMLWSGQILNALHVITCAALATYFWRRPMAGVVAGLVVGLLSIMPAYYVSWGRYTQLTGLLLLPPLAISWHAWLSRAARRDWLITAMLLAGLSIIHMRVLVFALALLAVIGVLWLLETDWATVRVRVWYGIGMGVLALVLAAPWLWHLLLHRLASAVDNPQNLVGGGGYNAFKDHLMWSGNNRWLIALALAAAVLGFWQRSRAAAIFVLWTAVLWLAANPWLIGYVLPAAGVLLVAWGLQQRQVFAVIIGGGMLLLNPALVSFPYLWLITNEVIIISLFLPMSVLIGGGACILYTRLHWWCPQSVEGTGAYCRFLLRIGAAIVLVLAAGWGTWDSRSVINRVTIFATPADVAAIAWAEEHTPADARFLINAKPWFADADRGADGGWWLLPLAGRWTSTPPALYTYGAPAYVQAARALSREIATFKPEQLERLYQLIDEEQITHIYLGQKAEPLSLDHFPNRSRFPIVYEQGGVTILGVKR